MLLRLFMLLLHQLTVMHDIHYVNRSPACLSTTNMALWSFARLLKEEYCKAFCPQSSLRVGKGGGGCLPVVRMTFLQGSRNAGMSGSGSDPAKKPPGVLSRSLYRSSQ